ncbi:hypothetical protein C1645_743748 [Glomus cerebriforme]|uniref:Uncharacterized protein n=1 Tax=Glomus cerebriforme TaxID=658196 RepID=A0A397SCC0_9GLOM|nr:hypothetical protein C1645_743748 [Glomus cerebriforme]
MEILNEEPMIEYRPFLNGLELDAYFQKYRIALEVQGAQHRLAGIKMSKNSRTSLIAIGKIDAYVRMMESSFLKYFTRQMGEKTNSGFRYTFQDSENRNTVRDRGYYGDPTVLSPSSHGNGVGRIVSAMDTLSHENGFRGGDELSRQVKLPWQNASQLDRQNQHDGNGEVFPHINSKFNDFGGRRGDNTVHVRDISSRGEENKNNTGIQMVASACSDRIRELSLSLGQLLRDDTLESITWDEKKPCHLVLPDDRPKIQKNEDNASMWQLSASDEKDGIHGYRNNFPMVVETFMKPNRCYIANSLGYKLHDKDQEDYISYIKEELIGYIEEVNRYGFDHIIIIGELYYGMLFLDIFGRVFNLDGMTDALWFLGDYFKGVERVAKGLATDRVPWILKPDEGTIVEIKNAPSEHYTFPVEKKHKKKKSSRKKHH